MQTVVGVLLYFLKVSIQVHHNLVHCTINTYCRPGGNHVKLSDTVGLLRVIGDPYKNVVFGKFKKSLQ